MKKTSVLVLLGLVVNLSVYSQIQRNFLGFTLGVTTKNQVINYAKENKMVFVAGNDEVCIKDIKFGGIYWPMVAFSFLSDKFYTVYFFNSDKYTPRNNLDVHWENLTSSLNAKYKNFLLEEKISETNSRYNDGITTLDAFYDFNQGIKTLSLLYYDNKLFMQNMQEDDNEL